MSTAMKRGFVLTKSVNAFQDGIHRRIAKVSAKNQPYFMEANLTPLVDADSATVKNSVWSSDFPIIFFGHFIQFLLTSQW